jgi:D-alanyl-D-alanine carboxypeptidase/D-alanyl-D-alanine-endopeptidase (penicillin-binding protein 4)
MKVKLTILFTLIISLASCSRTPHPTTLATDIDTMIAAFPTNPSLGIIIENLQTGQIIYQRDASRTFFPASTTKTITAVVALKYLGADYKFSTNLGTTGLVSANGVLNGDVYLHFTGDPTLTYIDLQKLLSSLSQHHIQQIKGNLYLDTYPFNGYKPASGFMWDDNNFYFSAPNDGVVLNGNAFTFYLWPGNTINSRAVVKPVDSMVFTPVTNNVMTQLDSPSNCVTDLTVDAQNHYTLNGCIPFNNPAMRFGVAVYNPTALFTAYLSNWLTQHQIKLSGKISSARSPTNVRVLATDYSVPLSQIVNTMLYRSDNLYANTLFLTVGAIYSDATASWENAQHSFTSLMKSMQVGTTNMVLIDGAGLSRYNQYSPLVLLGITEYAYQHPEVGDVYFPALSPSTRYKFLKEIPIAEHGATFHLKTGGMTNVATISGYLVTAKKTPLGIVIMANGDGTRQTLFGLNAQIITRVLKEDL